MEQKVLQIQDRQDSTDKTSPEGVRHEGKISNAGGKNWIVGPNGGSMAMDSVPCATMGEVAEYQSTRGEVNQETRPA